MKFPRIAALFICVGSILTLILAVTQASAYKLINDTTDPDKDIQVLILPYAFNSEASGFNYGIGGGVSGWPQKQAIVGGTVWQSPEGTDAIYLNITDLQLPFAKRLFLMVHGLESSYNNMTSYASGSGRASNSSSKNDYYGGHGWDQWGEAELSYVLPWGPHGETPIHTYTTNRGTLTDGSLYDGSYDPFQSGRSYLKLKPFYRNRWYRDDTQPNSAVETIGIRFTYEYDNTDFWYAPSIGSKTLLRLYQGIDTDRSHDWTSLELDLSSFWSLGETSAFQNRVIGMNFWLVDTPSWDYKDDGSVSGDSPYYMGAYLGGYTRQRGYPFYRFHDKAAYNVSLEYRLRPKWNPLDGFQWSKWWEVVPFVEVGRVAPYLGTNTVLNDVKWSTGVGLRTMVLNSVLRVDIAASEEGMNGWFMVNQTF